MITVSSIGLYRSTDKETIAQQHRSVNSKSELARRTISIDENLLFVSVSKEFSLRSSLITNLTKALLPYFCPNFFIIHDTLSHSGRKASTRTIIRPKDRIPHYQIIEAQETLITILFKIY